MNVKTQVVLDIMKNEPTAVKLDTAMKLLNLVALSGQSATEPPKSRPRKLQKAKPGFVKASPGTGRATREIVACVRDLGGKSVKIQHINNYMLNHYGLSEAGTCQRVLTACRKGRLRRVRKGEYDAVR